MAIETQAPTSATALDQPIVRDRLYIGGEWVEPAGAGTIEVVNSTTEEVIGSVPEGTVEDVDRAVEAAQDAFESWSQTTVEERAETLQSIAEALGARMDEISVLVSAEV